MRLFLAVDIDDGTRQAAAAWMRDVTERIGGQQGGRQAHLLREIKWVEAGNLHLTVHFFGHVDEARAGEIRRTLTASPLPTREFPLTIEGTGTFPPTGYARAFWLGVKDDGQAFATLHRDVEARLATIGAQEEADARPHVPHLTIGRVRTPSGALSRALRAALTPAPATFGHFTVRDVTLYESRLSPHGPTYVALDRVPLARAV